MMEVNLVSITEPRIEGIKTTQDFIAYCAKVSNPTNQLNTGTTDRLLKYLVRNKHFSPFEMVSIVLEIKTTRDIGRQILRHRSFSFQEFSQRYASPKLEDFINDREARLQDVKNRQNSIGIDDVVVQDNWELCQENVLQVAMEAYAWAISSGIAKEVARAVLPEGLTPTKLYMSGTLRSWIHYCDLRMGNGTQKEHQEIAKECWKIICEEIPALTEILNKEEKEEGNKITDAATTIKTDTKTELLSNPIPGNNTQI